MKFFMMVLALVVSTVLATAGAKAEEKDPCGGILVADTGFSTPTCVREYKTALGKFTVKVDFIGGPRHEVVVSPKGQETEMRSVALLRSVAGKVWAVDSLGVWLYDPKAGTFTETKRLGDERVFRCFSTKKGDFCALLPHSGHSKFAGLLYFDQIKQEWVEMKYPEISADSLPDYIVGDILVSNDGTTILVAAQWYDEPALVHAAGFIRYDMSKRSFF